MRRALAAVTCVVVVSLPALPASAAERSCDGWLAGARALPGLALESCRMIETPFTWKGRDYVRIDIGLSGTIDGVTTTSGPRNNYFTQFPEFVFEQVGNKAARKRGVGRFEADHGTAVVLLYPRERWNGRMWLTAHGAGPSFEAGTLDPWDFEADPGAPLGGISSYERLMIEKGFAVAKTRRPTHREVGDVEVTLEDGTVVKRNLTEQPRLVVGFGKVAGRALQERLGKEPTHTYWYGHSSGARPGRLLNYAPGANRDADGTPLIDGVLAGDSGAGLWLPILYRDGQDVLFRTDADRAGFVKQIDLSHMLYVEHTKDDPPAWASQNYLANKRINAKTLGEKGLGAKHRLYEIHGVSHSGAPDWHVSRQRGDVRILELAPLMGAFIDMLDAWVVGGKEPPPSRSDVAALGGGGGVRLPEVACPLGVHFQFPTSRGAAGVAQTGFAPFDGEGLEPLDGRGVVVDMNLNRYRDQRETVTEAWRRLGLLQGGETFSRERYVACVRSTAEGLRALRFLSEADAAAYAQAAAHGPVPAR
jgi:hypothetical protein